MALRAPLMSKRHPGRFSRPSTSGGGSAGPFLSKPAWAALKSRHLRHGFRLPQQRDRPGTSLLARACGCFLSPVDRGRGGVAKRRRERGASLRQGSNCPSPLHSPREKQGEGDTNVAANRQRSRTGANAAAPLPVLSLSKDYGERVRVRGGTSLQTLASSPP